MRMKSLMLALIFIFSVASGKMYANLGDSEQTQKGNFIGANLQELRVSQRAKVLVFTRPAGALYVMLLDGKTEIETYVFDDSIVVSDIDVVGKLKEYSQDWSITSSDEKVTRFASDDGEYFALVGTLKAMHSDNTFSVFSKKWLEYAKEQSKKI